MKKRFNTRQLTILGLLTGILLLMAYTPLGYLNIGPLAISFNVIPVALAAVTLGPAGGAAAGAVFGLTSFLQCVGVGGLSAMGPFSLASIPSWPLFSGLYPAFWTVFFLAIYSASFKRQAARVWAALSQDFSPHF